MASAQVTPAPTDQPHAAGEAEASPGTPRTASASTAETAWEPQRTCVVRSRRLSVPPTKSEVPQRPPASSARPFGPAFMGPQSAPGPPTLSQAAPATRNGS